MESESCTYILYFQQIDLCVYLLTTAMLPFRPGSFTSQKCNIVINYTVQIIAVGKRIVFQLCVLWGRAEKISLPVLMLCMYSAGMGVTVCRVPCQQSPLTSALLIPTNSYALPCWLTINCPAGPLYAVLKTNSLVTLAYNLLISYSLPTTPMTFFIAPPHQTG